MAGEFFSPIDMTFATRTIRTGPASAIRRSAEHGRTRGDGSHREPRARPPRHAFTLIETLIVLLILALLSTAVTLSLAGPLRKARAGEALAKVEEAVTTSRAHAIRFARETRLTIDLEQSTLSHQVSRNESRPFPLPSPYRISDVRTTERQHTSGTVPLVISPSGAFATFALRVEGPDFEQWLLVSGLTGEISRVPDESTVQSIFRTLSRPDAR